MRQSAVLLVICGLFLASCAAVPQARETSRSGDDPVGRKVYLELRDTLEASGKRIDYDTLMQVYLTMVRTRQEIPHKDRLLAALIE